MTDLKQDVDPEDVGLDPARVGRIDRYLQRYLDGGLLPNYVVALTRYGSVAHVASAGWQHVEDRVPVRGDTLFRLYSMTKPITSVAALILYEHGAFELSTPVSEFIPSFRDVRVFAGGSSLKQLTEPVLRPMTVGQLLTHTSGLTYGFHRIHPVDALYRARGFEWASPKGLDLAACCEVWAALPLLFQPGAEWAYSVATDVLGRVVEVASGSSLADFTAREILGPLGMTDTSFGVPQHRRNRLARLYARTSAGISPADALGAAPVAAGMLSGGGGLIGTAYDYHRFTQMLLNGGELDGIRILSPRTVAYMVRNHLPDNEDLETFGRPLYAEAPLRGVGFGLGVSVVLDPVRAGVLGNAGEFGWGGAASTYFFVDPAERTTLLLFTSAFPSSAYPIRPVLRQLANQAIVA
jgi:CubicO group peptidase (beta-lactamase class C family)